MSEIASGSGEGVEGTDKAASGPSAKTNSTSHLTPDTYWLLEGMTLLFLNAMGGLYVRGEENVPKTGSVLLVSNHISYLDPVSIGDASPRRVAFMAKASLFEKQPLGFLLRGVDSYPVRRGEPDRSAFKRTFELLDEGRVVCIFPRGTRQLDINDLGDAEPGAALFAAKTGCSVVPVFVRGTNDVLNLENKLHRGRITVTFGTPFTVPKSAGRDGGHLLMEAIARTRDQSSAPDLPARRIWPHWFHKRPEGSRARR